MNNKSIHSPINIENLVGQKFNQLTVLERLFKPKSKGTLWLCHCDCGKIIECLGYELKSNHKQSCGCLQQARRQKFNRIHSMSKTPLHAVWRTAIQRCTNPKNPQYKNYGARGISMSKEWQTSFEKFYLHVSQLENFGEKGYSLDRIDNNGNYEAGNIRWATKSQQCKNSRPSLRKNTISP